MLLPTLECVEWASGIGDLRCRHQRPCARYQQQDAETNYCSNDGACLQETWERPAPCGSLLAQFGVAHQQASLQLENKIWTYLQGRGRLQSMCQSGQLLYFRV